jgi:hypothetical protein
MQLWLVVSHHWVINLAVGGHYFPVVVNSVDPRCLQASVEFSNWRKVLGLFLAIQLRIAAPATHHNY